MQYRLGAGDVLSVDSSDYLPGFVRGTKLQTMTFTGSEGGVVYWLWRVVAIGGVVIPFERIATMRIDVNFDTDFKDGKAQKDGVDAAGTPILGAMPVPGFREASPGADGKVGPNTGRVRTAAGHFAPKGHAAVSGGPAKGA